MNEFSGITPAETIEKENEKLPPLPFTYERTGNKEEAQYSYRRVSLIKVWGKETDVYSDEDINKKVRIEKEKSQWYTSKEWRDKGQPQEQVEVQIGENTITIYNFSKEKTLTEEHLESTIRVIQEMASRFPEVLAKLRWILINDEQLPSAWGDSEKYPTSGMARSNWDAFEFYPRGLELSPYRQPYVSNFEGVFAHEMTHLIDGKFINEWQEKFKWISLYDRKGWDSRLSPDGTRLVFIHQETGQVVNSDYLPDQPEQCVSEYAKLNEREDICESMVAYLYQPEKLRELSPEKYEILAGHDANLPKTDVLIHKVAKEDISLPVIDPEVVKYYIEEPE